VIVGFIYRLLYRFRVSGLENIPEGEALICANHSSLSDAVIMALALRRKDRPRFIAKAELFKVFLLGRIISALGAYPVDRGKSDMAAIRTSLEILKQGKKLLIFPHGHRFTDGGEESAMKNGAAMLAFYSNAPLVPSYLSVGRKVFISKITVVFGKPFVAEKQEGLKSKENYKLLAEKLRNEIYALKPGGNRGEDA
jgi:1-acyl-sn-glycerol-3-phosphate acyltransferase